MITVLLLSLFLAADGEPPKYPTWKNHCWLSSPMLETMDDVTNYMDTQLSEWAGMHASVIPTYSNGVKWYVIYPEMSYERKCLAKVKKK
jgi:hypothetical protein